MIKTKRLKFVPLKNYDNFCKIYEDTSITEKWPEEEISCNKLDEKFKCKVKHWKDNGFGIFEIFLKSGDFVGIIGIEKENDYVKISGMSLSQYQGKFGVAVEAMYGLLKWVFDNNITDNVVAYMYENNALPQKFMVFFGGELFNKTLYKGSPSVYYRITKKSFEEL